MTPEQIARWRTKHPPFWATYLDDLLWNVRLCHAAPCLTVPEMMGYVADLDALRQMVPLAQASLSEARTWTLEQVESCRQLQVAATNAKRLLDQARELGWSV